MMRTILNLTRTIVLSTVLACGASAPPASAQAAALFRPAVLPVAQMAEEEHDHDHGLETDTDLWSNVAGPLVMIVAGLLYIGFMRWQTSRRRGAARPL